MPTAPHGKSVCAACPARHYVSVTAHTLQLVQMTDLHLLADPAGSLKGVNTLSSLQATLRAAAADLAAAQALLLSGDLVQDQPAAYAHLPPLLAPLGLPVLCIPGNHDLPRELAVRLQPPTFQVGGQKDLGHWRIVLLDSSVAGEAHGELGAAALAALDAQLSIVGDRHVLVVLHHPPLALGSAWLDDIGLQDGPALLALLHAHPCVRGVVFGHAHQAYDTQQGGLRLLGTPSTCAQFRPRSADFSLDDLPPAYRVLNLHDDGQISTCVVWVDSA